MKRLYIILGLVLFMLIGRPVLSADLEKGLSAFAKQDFEMALKEFLPLATQGSAYAQSMLGSMFLVGTGVTPKNFSEAFRWYSRAARQQHPYSQYVVAGMYKSGQGTLQDFTRAHMWWNILGAKDDESTMDYARHARTRRRALEKLMSPFQLETAQRLARECVEKNYRGC